MPDAGDKLRRHQVARHAVEKFKRPLPLYRACIRHIDDNLGARKRLRQARAGCSIDASCSRGSDDATYGGR